MFVACTSVFHWIINVYKYIYNRIIYSIIYIYIYCHFIIGNCGFHITICEEWRTKQQLSDTDPSVLASYLPLLFAEEVGFLFEILPEHIDVVVKLFKDANIDTLIIGIDKL